MTEEMLSLDFEVKLGDETHEVFMSYGLLNELTKIVGSPESVVQAHFDEVLRTKLLTALFTKRKKSGKPEGDSVDVSDLEISIEDVDAILTWALMHVTDFFVQGMLRSQEILKRQEAKIPMMET